MADLQTWDSKANLIHKEGELISVFDPFFILLRVLYLRTVYGPEPVVMFISHFGTHGGTELQFKLIGEGLNARSIPCMGILLGSSEGKSYVHFPLLDLGSRGGGAFLHSRLLKLIFKILGTEVVSIFKPASAPVIQIAKKCKMRVIYHETALPRKNSDYWNPLIPELKSIDHVVAVSEASLQGLREEFNFRGLATVLPPLIESIPEERASQNPIKSLQRDDQEVRFVYSGRLSLKKGLEDLLIAFSQISKVHPQFRLTLIGAGPAHAQLMELAKLLFIENKIEFLGELPRAQLLQELTKSDVFCLPSHTEGVPCSIREAVALGLPVIASRVGGIPEIIVHAQTGWLVSPQNPHELAQGMLTLGTHRELRKNLATLAREKYFSTLNEDLYFKTLMDAYLDRVTL